MIKGLIFAGGKSARMGYAKGLIDYHGKPQQEFLFDLLGHFCTVVFTSCKDANDVPAYLNPLPDRFTLESPLNGILTAFDQDASAAWLTVPVDMPYIDRTALDFLIRHRDPKKVATCFYDSDGKDPEPLLTLWEPSAYVPLQAYYNAGHRGVKFFLQQNDVHLVKPTSDKIHRNVNSEEELRIFLREKEAAEGKRTH
jgi:molybdopterin-guanine dinucleotide biosynthesis protein A